VWQATWQRIFAARNEKIAVRGVSAGFFLAGAILSISFITGSAARGFLPHDTQPDLVFTEIISSRLPPAVGGLVVAGLAAAIMSGGDSFIMMGTASVARDMYQQYFRPRATKTQMLSVSRWSALFISVTALAVALAGEGIIPLYILVVKTVGAGLVVPFCALMVWKRATRKGIIASMIAGISVTVGWYILGNPYGIEGVAGYGASLVTLILVSLMTDHAPDEQVKAAYFEPLEPEVYTDQVCCTKRGENHG
jgi:SSS family solute:Na+ symporter